MSVLHAIFFKTLSSKLVSGIAKFTSCRSDAGHKLYQLKSFFIAITFSREYFFVLLWNFSYLKLYPVCDIFTNFCVFEGGTRNVKVTSCRRHAGYKLHPLTPCSIDIIFKMNISLCCTKITVTSNFSLVCDAIFS